MHYTWLKKCLVKRRRVEAQSVTQAYSERKSELSQQESNHDLPITTTELQETRGIQANIHQ